MSSVFRSLLVAETHARILFTDVRHHSPAPAYGQESHAGWRSAAMYLFVGVAAMLALIGFASLVLVCTWCKLATGSLGQNARVPDPESMHSGPLKPQMTCSQDDKQEDKVLVIMPGQHEPTFLATQLSSSATQDTTEKGDL
ncbi:hypothetical protein SUGI_0896240 [Cryptomeria japonica]|uniref:protein GLUTAMINE DUMPER 3 n=1 Tax=Cryptomeria japonica TaxID=3369 RepID=UPI0024148C4D|nr:protein GLUTAMINE DUMPER 3 [Cryptomeria japonica]GLJ43169.1 hypothetical protein SUGI_0896240 [Cryptomeria japonica]